MKTIRLIKKRDAAQQLILTEIYLPNELDSQGDFIRAATLEKLAHQFTLDGHHKNVTVAHDGKPINAAVVESFVARKNDPDFKAGSWVGVIKIFDSAIWNLVQKGALRGVSFEGSGTRIDSTLNGRPAKEIVSGDITAISLVDKPATGRTFTMTKSDNAVQALVGTLNSLAEAITKQGDQLKKVGEMVNSMDAVVAGLERPAKTNGQSRLNKAEAEVNVKRDADINYKLRKMARMQERLESCWERPDLQDEANESDLHRKIQKCADRLHALGHEDQRAGLDTNSAFYERGGTSNFLTAGPSSLDDILGVSRQTQELRKYEAEIDFNCMVL